MGLGEIRLGEMGLGEMGLGEMGQNHLTITAILLRCHTTLIVHNFINKYKIRNSLFIKKNN